jgi:hypothetical protein
MLDVTNVGQLDRHTIRGRETVGIFAALITFYLAVRWPFWLFSRMRAHLGPIAIGPGAHRGASPPPAKAHAARASLARATLAAGGAVNAGARAAWSATPAARLVPASALRGGVAGISARATAAHVQRAAAGSGHPAVQAAAGQLAAKAGAVRDRASRATQAGRQAINAGGSPSDAVAAGHRDLRARSGANGGAPPRPTTPGASSAKGRKTPRRQPSPPPAPPERQDADPRRPAGPTPNPGHPATRPQRPQRDPTPQRPAPPAPAQPRRRARKED